MNPPSNTDTRALLEHAGWLRALAYRLVKDSEIADELSQDTWVRALENPPSTDEPLRGWLATVLRNVLRQRQRSEGRRSDRERRVPPALEAPAAGDLIERVAAQKDLAETVLELDEPYRKTILLRYFEECAPRQIARREGIPVSTVKTRLARGLEQLRTRLASKHDSRRGPWALALLPLTRAPLGSGPAAPASLTSLGTLLVNTKLAVALVLVTSVGLAVAMLPDREAAVGVAAPSLSAARPASSPSSPRTETETGEGTRLPQRSEREELAPAAPPTPRAATLPRLNAEGRVVGLDSRGLAGVTVELIAAGAGSGAPGEGTTRSGAQGRFRLELSEARGELRVRDEHLETVLFGRVRPGLETTLVVAPRLEVAGRVEDPQGGPIAGARIELQLPRDFRADFDSILDESRDGAWSTLSEADGSFQLHLPSIPRAKLRIAQRDFRAREIEAPSLSQTNLVVVLESATLETDRLTGTVLDPAGHPVEGAQVSFGIELTESDSRGNFTFDRANPTSPNLRLVQLTDRLPDRLRAVHPGYLPAELPPVRTDASGRALWSDPVVLRLGANPRSIGGRVVDGDGQPVEGAQVWIADPTVLGLRVDPESGSSHLTHMESELAGASPGWNAVATDALGRFALPGLLERSYRVEAMLPATLQRVSRPGVPAGTEDLELVLSAEQVFEVLRGEVVDRNGEGLEGVTVFPMCDTLVLEIEGNRAGTYHATAQATTTDERGRFELRNVPRNLAYLRLNGDDTIPLEWGRHVEGGLESLIGKGWDRVRIPLSRRCHFQVELGDPEEADEIAVLDSQGVELEISEFLGNGRREALRYNLVDGRSNTLGVGDGAATLVLFRAGQEVRRAELHLQPGERLLVRP